MTYLEMVREFHQTYNVPIHETPGWPDVSRVRLRESLLSEEFGELMDAINSRSLIKTADGLADLMVILLGTALEFGIPMDRVFSEVHRSNMSKIGEDGKPIYRADGKVIKGPNFSPPNIADILF